MDVDIADTRNNILDTVEGEIYFFRALMRARPVGIHRYFHVLSMKHSIEKGTGHNVAIDDIWQKLRDIYNMDTLESLEAEYEATTGYNTSAPLVFQSPLPSQNLAGHPFFKSEFTLPAEEFFDSQLAARRVRATPSLPSSPAPQAPLSTGRRGKKRAVSKVDLAGLVSGDSDSSALTVESGDDAEEGAATQSERGSGASESDARSGDGDEEDTETLPDTIKKRGPQKKKAAASKTRAAAASKTMTGKKKKK